MQTLTVMLAELDLEPKAANTRIVHLREGGEGFDFLGFYHRWARARSQRHRHVQFLACWPSEKAIRQVRDRIRELTDRRRQLLPVEVIVADVNSLSRLWTERRICRRPATDALEPVVVKPDQSHHRLLGAMPDAHALLRAHHGDPPAPAPRKQPWY